MQPHSACTIRNKFASCGASHMMHWKVSDSLCFPLVRAGCARLCPRQVQPLAYLCILVHVMKPFRWRFLRCMCFSSCLGLICHLLGAICIIPSRGWTCFWLKTNSREAMGHSEYVLLCVLQACSWSFVFLPQVCHAAEAHVF